MQGISAFLLLLLASSSVWAIKPAYLPQLQGHLSALREDLSLIEKKAHFPKGTITLGPLEKSEKLESSIQCQKDKIIIQVKAVEGETAATFYKAIKELGFLFPHPMVQISPKLADLKKKCGKVYKWRPALRYRGSHLHNLHPNEWVHGFYLNKPAIAEAMVRWLARNGQNLLEMSILRTTPFEQLVSGLKPQFELAKKLEIHTGVTIGLAFTQQKSYKLLSVWQSIFGWGAEESIEEGLKKLFRHLPLSFIFLEAGTSEFTPTNYDKTLEWLDFAAHVGRKHHAQIFTRAHISTNQVHKKYGNYNFLSQFAHETVGVLPHTVMFYGLLDEKAPIYGNTSFENLKTFMLQEKDKRPTWYYPETSYWIGMDLDIPLLLTDYLLTRAQDYKFLYLQQNEGQINFTTGHALGSWLYDWNLALINDLDHDFNPLSGLELLGESKDFWLKEMNFQHEYFKKKGLIAILSSANLQDELSETERIHNRYTMKQLWHNPAQVEVEIDLLQSALKVWPDYSAVKNPELKKLLEINKLRAMHALALREGLKFRGQKKQYVERGKNFRRQAQSLVQEISEYPTSYPSLPLFKEHANPTSYQFGYAFPAESAYFWKREERQILSGSFAPWNGNMYNVWQILF